MHIAFGPALGDLAFVEADIASDILDALAGIAGQLLGEVADRLGGHQLAHPAEIAVAPCLLHRGMDALKGVEIAVVDRGVLAAIPRYRRRRGGADRARHRAASGPGEGEAAPVV